CVRPSASSRRSIVAVSISSPRAAPSTSAVRGGISGTRRMWDCATASGVRSSGIAHRGGSDLNDPIGKAQIGKAQDQLFAPGRSSRAKYAALVVGRPGLGALLKYELVVTL